MDIKKFYGICLQGNVIEAIKYLTTIKDKNNDMLKLEKQYEDRFLSQKEIYRINSDDPWIIAVLNCYFAYFRSVLTNNSQEEAEERLLGSLKDILGICKETDLDEVETELENIFKEKGYSFLGGITLPYRGPYIWKTTRKEDFLVTLPGGEQKVTVYIISDFLMLSWAHYATFGRHYAGGWAKPEGLYYVNADNEELKVNSIEFQVSFLKHEAQHLSDYEKYPRLDASNLEYRAKLIELIYSPNPHILIEKFIAQSKNDKLLSHPYASYSIIKRLSYKIFGKEFVEDKEQWWNIDSSIISTEAYCLFTTNENDLQQRGYDTECII